MTGLNNVLIVGAGPAGMAAALQLRRFGVECTLFEKKTLGGLLHNANLVENYLGFPGGIPGPDLVALFERQLQGVGVSMTGAEVQSLGYSSGVFHLITPQREYEAAIAVVASGTQPRRFTQLEFSEAVKERVYYEVAPLLHIKGKSIAIVGAGDAAFDYALNLGKNNQVIILNHGQTVKCLPLLWERVQSAQTIHYRAGAALLSVAEGLHGGLSITHTSEDETSQLQADYLIGALGREPCLDFLTSELEKQADELQKQGVLYFVGDVKNQHYRQTAIAVGDGIMAAMKIYEAVRARSV